jgi:transposase
MKRDREIDETAFAIFLAVIVERQPHINCFSHFHCIFLFTDRRQKMKFFTFAAFVALLAVASANDVKERIKQHRESQKLDREVTSFLSSLSLVAVAYIHLTTLIHFYSL